MISFERSTPVRSIPKQPSAGIKDISPYSFEILKDGSCDNSEKFINLNSSIVGEVSYPNFGAFGYSNSS